MGLPPNSLATSERRRRRFTRRRARCPQPTCKTDFAGACLPSTLAANSLGQPLRLDCPGSAFLPTPANTLKNTKRDHSLNHNGAGVRKCSDSTTLIARNGTVADVGLLIRSSRRASSFAQGPPRPPRVQTEKAPVASAARGETAIHTCKVRYSGSENGWIAEIEAVSSLIDRSRLVLGTASEPG